MTRIMTRINDSNERPGSRPTRMAGEPKRALPILDPDAAHDTDSDEHTHTDSDTDPDAGPAGLG